MPEIVPATNTTSAAPPVLNEKMTEFVAVLVKCQVRKDEAIKEFEKQFIVHLLIEYGGNQCKAARAAGIHRNSLSRQIAEHKIDVRKLLEYARKKRPIPQSVVQNLCKAG